MGFLRRQPMRDPCARSRAGQDKPCGPEVSRPHALYCACGAALGGAVLRAGGGVGGGQGGTPRKYVPQIPCSARPPPPTSSSTQPPSPTRHPPRFTACDNAAVDNAGTACRTAQPADNTTRCWTQRLFCSCCLPRLPPAAPANWRPQNNLSFDAELLYPFWSLTRRRELHTTLGQGMQHSTRCCAACAVQP